MPFPLQSYVPSLRPLQAKCEIFAHRELVAWHGMARHSGAGHKGIEYSINMPIWPLPLVYGASASSPCPMLSWRILMFVVYLLVR